MKPIVCILSAVVCSVLFSCKESAASSKNKNQSEKVTTKIERKKPGNVTYNFENTKEWLKKATNDSAQLQLAYAINRTDAENFKKLDSVIRSK